MIIEINKDIDRYQESVALGLGGRQLVFSAVSLISGAGIVLLLYRYIGLAGSAYVAIPVVAPIALSGFYSYNGMSFFNVMGRKIHMMFGNRALTYISTESEAAIKVYPSEKMNQPKFVVKKGMGKKESKESELKKSEKPETSENKEEFEVMKKKVNGMLIGCIVIVVLAVAGTAAYQHFK